MKFRLSAPALTGIFLLLLSILGSGLLAQEGKVKLTFVAFPRNNDVLTTDLYLGKETIKVNLPTNSISEAYIVPRMQNWVLGEAGVDAEGNPTFDIKGKAKAHAAREQLVLVIHKGDGFELMPIPRNDQGLGGGKYFFYNASQAEIAGQIGDEKFSLKKNGHQILAPNPDQVNGIKKLVQMKAFFRINGNVQPFFSSMWRFNEDARTMVFFFNDSTGHLKLHTIRSFVN